LPILTRFGLSLLKMANGQRNLDPVSPPLRNRYETHIHAFDAL
jgi:hypothetical protein